MWQGFPSAAQRAAHPGRWLVKTGPVATRSDPILRERLGICRITFARPSRGLDYPTLFITWEATGLQVDFGATDDGELEESGEYLKWQFWPVDDDGNRVSLGP